MFLEVPREAIFNADLTFLPRHKAGIEAPLY